MTYNQNVKKNDWRIFAFLFYQNDICIIIIIILIGIFAFLNGRETYLNINLKKNYTIKKRMEKRSKNSSILHIAPENFSRTKARFELERILLQPHTSKDLSE